MAALSVVQHNKTGVSKEMRMRHTCMNQVLNAPILIRDRRVHAQLIVAIHHVISELSDQVFRSLFICILVIVQVYRTRTPVARWPQSSAGSEKYHAMDCAATKLKQKMGWHWMQQVQ